MQELQVDSRIKIIASGKKKKCSKFSVRNFMSPLFDACSLAIIDRRRNIGWMWNLYCWEEEELLYPIACKRRL